MAGDLLELETTEVSKLDHPGLPRMRSRQPLERIVQFDQVVAGVRRRFSHAIEIEGDPARAAAAFHRSGPTGVVHQYPAHRAGGQGEEMGPVDDFGRRARHAEKGLVDERGRLQGVVAAFAPHVALGQATELVVHTGGELSVARIRLRWWRVLVGHGHFGVRARRAQIESTAGQRRGGHEPSDCTYCRGGRPVDLVGIVAAMRLRIAVTSSPRVVFSPHRERAMRTFLAAGTRFVMIAALIVGCSDDDDKSTAPDDTPLPIIGAVTGVVESAGGTLEDARVSAGGATTFTNEDGYFALPDMDVGDVVVEVTRDGFAPAYRSVSVREGQTTHLARVFMLSTGTTEIAGGTGGSVTSPDGNAAVELTGGSLVTDSGAPYDGDVTVTMSSARPGDVDFFDAFPGRFEGRRSDGTVVPFESFGFASVALTESGSQQPLRLASGETAEIRMTVDNPRLASAPETIPLWYFDESEGAWIEEGAATLVGDTYEGDVSHFTIWNWDVPIDDVCTIEGTVVSGQGTSVVDARVFVKGLDATFLDEGLTDAMGRFSARALRSSTASVWAMKGSTVSNPVTVSIGELCPVVVEVPLTLVQALFTIVLSWGLTPDDLDAHLFVPMDWQIGGESYDYFHIAYYEEGSASSEPFAFLDTDDTDSYGPEIINGLGTFDGTYEYWVQRYADQGSIVDSPTVVSVQTPSQYRVFDAREASGSETEYWHVCNMVVSGNTIQIVAVNRFENAGTEDEWENWHNGEDTFYPDTGPEALRRSKIK